MSNLKISDPIAALLNILIFRIIKEVATSAMIRMEERSEKPLNTVLSTNGNSDLTARKRRRIMYPNQKLNRKSGFFAVFIETSLNK